MEALAEPPAWLPASRRYAAGPHGTTAATAVVAVAEAGGGGNGGGGAVGNAAGTGGGGGDGPPAVGTRGEGCSAAVGPTAAAERRGGRGGRGGRRRDGGRADPPAPRRERTLWHAHSKDRIPGSRCPETPVKTRSTPRSAPRPCQPQTPPLSLCWSPAPWTNGGALCDRP